MSQTQHYLYEADQFWFEPPDTAPDWAKANDLIGEYVSLAEAEAAEERAEKAEAAFTAAGNRADRAQDRADRANEEIGKLEDGLDRAESKVARILSPEAVEAAVKAAHPLWPMYTPGQKLRLREEFKRALQAALNAATDPKETNDGE